MYVLKVTLNKHRNVSDCTRQHCAVTELRFEQELCFLGLWDRGTMLVLFIQTHYQNLKIPHPAVIQDLTVSVV